MKHGYGKLYDPCLKHTYEGEWKFNRKNGKGTLWYDTQKVKLLYKGAFKNNRINGYGQKYFKTHCNIVEYNGYFKNGKPHNSCLQFDEFGNKIYDGKWKYGLKYGYGKFFDNKTGNRYNGYFNDNEFHGCGRLIDKNNILIYRGECQRNKKHGTGKFIDIKNKITYIGEFQYDIFEGIGELYQNYKVIRKGKLIYKGKFQNGEQLETYKIEIPKNFICPISFKIMKNPHQTTIGSVYEKDAIEKWLKTNNRPINKCYTTK